MRNLRPLGSKTPYISFLSGLISLISLDFNIDILLLFLFILPIFYFISSSIQFHKVSVTPNVGQKQYYWFQGFSGKFLRIRASKLLISTAESRFCLSFEVYGCRPGSFGKSAFSPL